MKYPKQMNVKYYTLESVIFYHYVEEYFLGPLFGFKGIA
jgi:hypothetical protein